MIPPLLAFFSFHSIYDFIHGYGSVEYCPSVSLAHCSDYMWSGVVMTSARNHMRNLFTTEHCCRPRRSRAWTSPNDKLCVNSPGVFIFAWYRLYSKLSASFMIKVVTFHIKYGLSISFCWLAGGNPVKMTWLHDEIKETEPKLDRFRDLRYQKDKGEYFVYRAMDREWDTEWMSEETEETSNFPKPAAKLKSWHLQCLLWCHNNDTHTHTLVQCTDFQHPCELIVPTWEKGRMRKRFDTLRWCTYTLLHMTSVRELVMLNVCCFVHSRWTITVCDDIWFKYPFKCALEAKPQSNNNKNIDTHAQKPATPQPNPYT